MLSVTLLPLSAALLLAQLAATWAMVGLIWFVQRVHYPLFARVDPRAFPAYETEHVARTGAVVGPPMVLEAGCALALLVVPVAGVPTASAWFGALLLAVVWGSTALQQVPRHRELSRGFDRRSHQLLVASNRIRALAWTLRGVLAVWMLWAWAAEVAAP